MVKLQLSSLNVCSCQHIIMCKTYSYSAPPEHRVTALNSLIRHNLKIGEISNTPPTLLRYTHRHNTPCSDQVVPVCMAGREERGQYPSEGFSSTPTTPLFPRIMFSFWVTSPAFQGSESGSVQGLSITQPIRQGALDKSPLYNKCLIFDLHRWERSHSTVARVPLLGQLAQTPAFRNGERHVQLPFHMCHTNTIFKHTLMQPFLL